MLENQWHDMEDIFVDLLHVPNLTFDMVYGKLKSLGSSSEIGVSEAKETIEALNSFLARGDGRHTNPRDILRASVFPVRQPQGSVQLVNASMPFAIPDRQHWEEAFKDKISMLDFSLSAIQRLKPFLQWLDLESRYLSVGVREGSRVRPDALYR